MSAAAEGDPWAGAHRHPVRVYYEDTDFSGVVYHASFLRFLERGRTELLRDLGISQSGLHAAAGPGEPPGAFAVRHMSLDFVRPAGMDDALVVETRVAAAGGASLAMAQRVLRGAELLVSAEVRIAFVAGGRARRLPPALAARLAGSGR